MARLVQGDVGSGKTVVALAALLTAIEAGCQGALMAPTEVLAQQHATKIISWLNQLHVRSALLTGSTPMKQRRSILEDLANGQLQLLVGTHALLEDPVDFARLGLVVVDEQHRFGVNQRNRLLAKGLQPHLLTMTATPIPRTLALSLHGDLDVSQIDELPPDRQPIETRVLRGSARQQAYELIRDQVARGQRAYVVLPLVEESEKLELRSAVEVHAQLSQEVFADLRVGLLHGRLSSDAKQQAIGAFADGETQVLVSTTVVEVGVDVPAATVMVIEHADRFGLAQLHQLRGRVGRGAARSYCLLINDSSNPQAAQRLNLLERSNDGFEIAEMDLRLRGPGQVLGTRQSGLPDLALASLSTDGAVLERARAVAQQITARDPDLTNHPLLARMLQDQRRRQIEAAVQLN
jgi:ATP-dependent DNA helicase RecG